MVISHFRDGRASSGLVEMWAEQLYGIRRMGSDYPGFDAMDGTRRIFIRCVTERGVYLQRSINIGGGRTMSKEQLDLAVNEVDIFIFADIAEFPMVKFIPATRKQVIDMIKRGYVTKNGLVTRADLNRCLLPRGGLVDWGAVLEMTKAA